MPDFDLFVIGGGSGGVACARRAAGYGARVGIAESSRMGGTCVIRGCVPKKLMHYGAHFADWFKAARGFGWTVRSEPSFAELIANRNREIARLNGIYISMLEQARVAIVPHRATLRPDKVDGAFVVRADGREMTAARVLVAVGGRPALPPVEGIEHVATSDFVLEEAYDLPERVAVIGGGYIGVELASIMNAFGADTHVVLRGDIPLRGFDHDLREELTRQFTERGVRLSGNTMIERVEPAGNALRLSTTGERLEVDMVIYATGRHSLPNTREMGLEQLGVTMDDKGTIVVGNTYESHLPGLFAVGDCSDHAGSGITSGQFDLTPIAIAEGRAVAERLFNDNDQAVRYETVPTAIFALPQGGSCGLSEERARHLGHDVTIFRTRFRPMLQTLGGGEDKIMMKLVVDGETDRVLGCHMVGDEAGEIIQGLAVALTAGATKRQFDETVALHPTAAEEFVTMYQPAG